MSNIENNNTLVSDIRNVWSNARSNAPRSVDTELVKANWLIGKRIVEEAQSGKERAHYGDQLIPMLSKQLQKELGEGFSVSSLKDVRKLYLLYPKAFEIRHAVSGQFNPDQLNPALSWTHYRALMRVEDQLRQELLREIQELSNE